MLNSCKEPILHNSRKLSTKTAQISPVEISSSKTSTTELLGKIDEITHDLSKPYFRNALVKLVKESGDNANIICDYIIAEINEINIKPLAREGKIKILLWPAGSIKIFLNMTAIGFILFSLSYTIDASVGSYPPYAANSFSLFPISVFMVLFGVYGAGLSLSQDIVLRKRIQSLARGDQNLLSSIGTAQMENEVTRVVGNLKTIVDYEETKLKQSSGLHTPMEKDEIESYLGQVIIEIKKSHKKF